MHAVNAALVTVLAWTLLGLCFSQDGATSSLTGQEDDRDGLSARAAAAGLVGVVFAVHPLQAETVAWIAGRTQLLCGMMMVGCVLAHILAAQTGRGGWRWLAAVLFVMACLSKPIVVTLPLVLLVLDWYPLRRYLTIGWRRCVREKLWMFAIGIVLAILSFSFASPTGMAPSVESLGPGLRALVAERAVAFYVWKLLWPAWLSPYYPLEGTISLTRAEFFVPALALTMFCVGVWLLRRRLPAVAAAWMAYLALLLPVSGLTQFGGEAVANRHMYVAMLPLLLVLAGAVAWLWQRARTAGRVLLMIVVTAALGCLGARTWVDVKMWHDDETMWGNVVRWYPDLPFANWKLTEATIARRDYAAALPYAERAAEGYPNDVEVKGILGSLYLNNHRYEAAVRTLLPLAHADLWLPAARYNLACAYARLGSNDAALAVLREVLPREPRFLEAAKRDRELAGLRSDPQFAKMLGEPVP